MQPIILHGDGYTIRATPQEFAIYHVNHTVVTDADKKGPRAFYMLLRDQGEKLKKLDFEDLVATISKAGIYTRSYISD